MNGFQSVIKIFAICLAVFIIVNIFGWLIFGLSFLTHLGNYRDDDSYTSETITEIKDFSETYKNVKEIDIDVEYAKLCIKQGEEFRVEAGGMKSNFSSKVKDGKLKIEEHKIWSWNNNPSGYIIIYIPQDINLEELDIDTGAGQTEIDSVSAEKLNLDHGAGYVRISNSNFDAANIEGGAGKIEVISSSLNDLKLDAGVGKTEIEAEITGNSRINCGVGEVSIILEGNKEDYKIRAERGIGSLKIAGESISNDEIYGNGKNSIRVEGGIGSINIDFEN